MAEQIGIVTGIDSNGWARVLSDRKGACGGCHSGQSSGCRSCLASAKFESRVSNPVGAQPGDLVKVRLDSMDFYKGAALLYLSPIAALMVGAIVGAWIAELTGIQQTTGGVFGAIVGIGVAVASLIRLDRSQLTMRRLTPSVVEVLSVAKSNSQPTAVHHACCS